MMDRELLWHGFAVSAAHPYLYVTIIMADADCAFVLLLLHTLCRLYLAVC